MGCSSMDIGSFGNNPFFMLFGHLNYLFVLFLLDIFGNTLKLIIFVIRNLKMN